MEVGEGGWGVGFGGRFDTGSATKQPSSPHLFIYLFNFIYTRVKTSGLKGNTKITLIILSKYLSTTKLNLMTVKKIKTITK